MSFDPRKENWIVTDPVLETEMRNLVASLLKSVGIYDASCLEDTPSRIMLPHILYDAEIQVINTTSNLNRPGFKRVTLKQLFTAIETIINAKSML